jgi:hypothetical protein
MTERLTDEQVAAAASGTFVGDVQYLILDLAVEVQQARQRRCGNCAAWRGATKPTTRDLGECRHADTYASGSVTLADWFCADFKAKP